MTMITKLTPAQQARFPEFVRKWIDIGLSTESADRDRAERAIAGLYDLAKLAVKKLGKLDRGALVCIRPALGAGKDEDVAGDPIFIPPNIFRAMVKMLAEMGKGNAVAIVPLSAELTTQQAADVLNVSRPYLVKLLNDRVLPYSMVGTHRRLPARAVLNYRDKCVQARREALTEMIALDHELGIDDDDPAGAEE